MRSLPFYVQMTDHSTSYRDFTYDYLMLIIHYVIVYRNTIAINENDILFIPSHSTSTQKIFTIRLQSLSYLINSNDININHDWKHLTSVHADAGVIINTITTCFNVHNA